jgi:hypothetical protein
MTPKQFRKQFASPSPDSTGKAERVGSLIDDLNAAYALNDRLRRMLQMVLRADRSTGGLPGAQRRIREEFPDLENTN